MSDHKEFSLRFPMTLGLLTLVVLLGGFGYWAATTNISGAIIASGSIEVDQNRQVVQHPDGGVVAEILVDEGDTVTVGDVLAAAGSHPVCNLSWPSRMGSTLNWVPAERGCRLNGMS